MRVPSRTLTITWWKDGINMAWFLSISASTYRWASKDSWSIMWKVTDRCNYVSVAIFYLSMREKGNMQQHQNNSLCSTHNSHCSWETFKKWGGKNTAWSYEPECWHSSTISRAEVTTAEWYTDTHVGDDAPYPLSAIIVVHVWKLDIGTLTMQS